MERENRQRRVSGKLSEKEEMLLMRYCDGEGSFIVRWGARRLLRSHPAAKAFIEDVQLCGDVARQRGWSIEQSLSPSWSVAPGVQVDVEKQERFTQVLGSRTPWFSLNPEMVSRLGWGATGALTAASLFLVMAPPTGGSGAKMGASGASIVQAGALSSVGIQPVALKSSSFANEDTEDADRGRRLRVGVVRGNAPRHGVEWFRSRGELQFIESPRARGPIMWVMRSGPASRRTSRPQVVPTVAFVGGGGAAQGEMVARVGQ